MINSILYKLYYLFKMSYFYIYLFAMKILEYNFSQLNCYRNDKFPFH